MINSRIIALGFLACVASSVAMAGGDPAKGKELAEKVCAACHGADGNSELPANPKLAGQYESYLIQALKGYRSGARQNPIMAGFATALSDEDIANAAAYFASQPGTLATLER